MRTVLRNDEGEITHVRAFANVFMTKRDHEKFLDHTVTMEEVRDYFGEDNLLEILTEMANGDYDPYWLRHDVMSYNNLFVDEVIKDEDKRK